MFSLLTDIGSFYIKFQFPDPFSHLSVILAVLVFF